MKKRTLLGFSVAAALAFSACGGSDSASDTTAAPADTTATGSGVDLSDVCPTTVIFQTDWNPESEHG